MEFELQDKEKMNLNEEKKHTGKKKKKNISYRHEVLRKGIHMCSLSIPVIYFYLDKFTAALILGILAATAIIIDVVTKLSPQMREVYFKIFGGILRRHEKFDKRILLNGASWVLISAFLTVLIFPKLIAITALAVLVISDIAAALFGRKFGKTPFFDKSLEGSTAFFISGALVVSYISFMNGLPVYFYLFGIISVIAAAVIEAASTVLKMDDNLSVPMSIGVILWIGDIAARHLGEGYLNII